MTRANSEPASFQNLSQQEWLKAILRGVVDRRSESFVGAGVIVYESPMCLPVYPLVASDAPIQFSDPQAIADYILNAASPQSPLHDGFHLLDGSNFWLTHSAQFFSPPIKRTELKGPFRGGARAMAALFGSMLDGVFMTATIGKSGLAKIYLRGFEERFE